MGCPAPLRQNAGPLPFFTLPDLPCAAASAGSDKASTARTRKNDRAISVLLSGLMEVTHGACHVRSVVILAKFRGILSGGRPVHRTTGLGRRTITPTPGR